MDEEMIDYIANILASALLSAKKEADKKILRNEHEKVVKRILNK